MTGDVSLTAELRIARLKFLQNMLKGIHTHELYLATLFGRYCFGRISLGRDNPWIEQFHRDMFALSELGGMIWVCSSMLDSGLPQLVYIIEVRNQFVEFDVTELKAKELFHVSQYTIDVNAVDDSERMYSQDETCTQCYQTRRMYCK